MRSNLKIMAAVLFLGTLAGLVIGSYYLGESIKAQNDQSRPVTVGLIEPTLRPAFHERASRSRMTPQPEATRAVPRSPHVIAHKAKAMGASAFPVWWRAQAMKVAQCESSGDPQAVSSTGKYRGLLQFDADFWATYGGLEYAPRPDEASEHQQLVVAYHGWLARGWSPWTCRSVL